MMGLVKCPKCGHEFFASEIEPDESSIKSEQAEVINEWKRLFPDKVQPRRASGTSTMRKLRTRLKDKWWKENWKECLHRASESVTLSSASWFTFEYLVRNDTNLEKIHSGWMNWKDVEKEKEDQSLTKAQNEKAERDRESGVLDGYLRQAFKLQDEDNRDGILRLLTKVDDTLGYEQARSIRWELSSRRNKRENKEK